MPQTSSSESSNMTTIIIDQKIFGQEFVQNKGLLNFFELLCEFTQHELSWRDKHARQVEQ